MDWWTGSPLGGTEIIGACVSGISDSIRTKYRFHIRTDVVNSGIPNHSFLDRKGDLVIEFVPNVQTIKVATLWQLWLDYDVPSEILWVSTVNEKNATPDIDVCWQGRCVKPMFRLLWLRVCGLQNYSPVGDNAPKTSKAAPARLLVCLQWHINNQTNSVAWVRERTIQTERQPFVGEVIANFCE
jgi:hypothetical protein